ncbi:MAG TPA: MBL fold metallo-hydrolase [Stellaceae bacterium]|nr:MBL fold metallo-hydrolase [Stellaceae bacterium]
MDVRAISGFGDKSPACFLVTIADRRFLLDLGEGPEPGKFPDLSGLGAIDAILISHSHKDHIGGLKLLDRIGSPPVYATSMVRDIGKLPALTHARDLPLQGMVDILGVTVETGRASHAPGGIWMRLGGAEGVLYTGDWTRESPLYDLDPMPPARVLVCDASYGAYEVPLGEGIGKLLAEAAKGPLLLPMPPAGRGLDVALALSEVGCSIALCPAHRQVIDRLLASDRGEVTASTRERLATLTKKAAKLESDSNPHGVMLAGIADASEGLAAALARRFADESSAAIIFTGFVAEGTLGKELIQVGKAGFIRWNVHPLASDVAWVVDQVRPQAVMPVFAGIEACRDVARAYPTIPFDLTGHIAL